MFTIKSTRDVQSIIKLVDQWAVLLEKEFYDDAYAFTSHDKNGWSAVTIGEVIKAYDECLPSQKVTLYGVSNELVQRKDIVFIKEPDDNRIGSLWYDLNINGRTTDLTATFTIIDDGMNLWLQLDDIHVM